MNFIRIIALLGVLALVSCKKNRICECTNSQGTYDAGEVEMNKTQAKKYCKGLSAGETSCKLKG
jgi:hypothetical protein